MANLPGKQSNAIEGLKLDLKLRMNYLQIFAEIKDHEKSVATLKQTIENYKKGLFKPPQGDMNRYYSALATHEARIVTLKEDAEWQHRGLPSKKKMLATLESAIDEIGIVHGLDD